ncbi:MAG: glycine dehydrogenase, partial [Muribaculaceae bacterium]|nr:glycine dehydrogenase [Muribaculaceae bacterium]
MPHRYFPHSQEDIASMLETCGVKSLDDLYADVPEQLKFKGTYNVPSEMSEHEVRKFFNTLGKKNTSFDT